MWICLLLLVGIPKISQSSREPAVLEGQLRNWTTTFGNAIFDFGNVATKYDEMQRRFQTSPDSSVNPIDMKKMVEEMANETFVTFKEKVDAIRKIMHWAEQKAQEYFDRPQKQREEEAPKSYLNARKINSNLTAHEMSAKKSEDAPTKALDPLLNRTLDLHSDDHFGSDVNLNCSTVHVPSSVFDRRPDILDGIHWTNGMDEMFTSNYAKNPTLMWQYFGSSLGFFRQYPAMKWPNDNTKKAMPDLYDCRTRPWYTHAANSPKNIIILQDTSGSMMGLRREIARHVVFTVLDTLTENDYVSVLNFTDVTTAVVPCYNESLVQANLENVREFKVGLDQDRTHGMANFTTALKLAYHILEKHRDMNKTDTANCNEAIMLITDGAPELYNEIFDIHNKVMRGRTRVFTYLIGRDVTETNEVLGIACSNKGYFTHVTTLGEVQEQVLKYLAVMSRPMVMDNTHSVSWTNVYADIAEIVESDWQWDEKNREQQLKRSQRYQEFLKRRSVFHGGNETEGLDFYVIPKDDESPPPPPTRKKKGGYVYPQRVADYLDYGMITPTDDIVREIEASEERRKREQIASNPVRKFRFMVSVSLPVFDQRNVTDKEIPEVDPKKPDKSETQPPVNITVKEKIAIFLGVVGTDIPISEFKKIATPFKVGVNGYSFALTENGHVLFHPEWRPLVLLTDVLKPNYNAVDLSKIELVDSDRYHRNLDPDLLKMRKDMLNIESGEEAHVKSLPVRVPLDDFKRVILRRQKYAYAKIPSTTYTLAIAIPETHQYEFSGSMEIRRDHQGKNITHFFERPDEPRHWRVNPDWTYCEYIRGNHPEFHGNKEGLILHFLREIQQANHSWRWRNTGIGIERRQMQSNFDSQIYICDKQLVQSLVFDANVTGIFTLKWFRSYLKDKGQIMNPFGPIVGFIATRSGLTRWVNYTDTTSYEPFTHSDIRATEELWYKRAVERYEVDRGMSYVLSVPYDAGTRSDSFVTASRAIYVHRNRGNRGQQQSAPVAVAGIQFEHRKMQNRFFEISSRCDGSGCLKCNDNLDCYVIDDNGYIVISSQTVFTGRFFGEVHGEIMEQLTNHDIYKRVRVVDYQAICFHLYSKSFGFILQNPFKYVKWIIKWFIGRLAWLALQINLHSYFSPDFASVLADAVYNDEIITFDDRDDRQPFAEMASVNKSRLRQCHQEYQLYTYGRKYYADLYNKGYHPGILPDCDGLGHQGFYGVHLINRTNLIMVAIDAKCRPSRSKKGIIGQEVQYEIEEEIEKMAETNDVLTQICRTPLIHLDRKKPTAKCLYYNEDEKDLRPECGGKESLHSSFALLLPLLSIHFLARFFT